MDSPRNATDEAKEIFRTRIEVPKMYLKAFHATQKLEVYLRWIMVSFIEKVQSKLKDSEISFKPKVDNDLTAKQYLTRIKTYLPVEENKNFYKKVNCAIDKRNNFVHNCFKIINKKGIGISLDMDAFHLNETSLNVLREWTTAFSEAETVILTVLARLLRI